MLTEQALADTAAQPVGTFAKRKLIEWRNTIKSASTYEQISTQFPFIFVLCNLNVR